MINIIAKSHVFAGQIADATTQIGWNVRSKSVGAVAFFAYTVSGINKAIFVVHEIG
jgi:hypothetical protein